MSLWEMCTQTKNAPITGGPSVVDRERQARTTAYNREKGDKALPPSKGQSGSALSRTD